MNQRLTTADTDGQAHASAADPRQAGAAALKPLLTSRQAAAVLNICERTLWELTHRGDIPVVRIGRAVRYDVRDLLSYIEHRKNG